MFDSIKGKIIFEAIVPDAADFINAIKKSCISADSVQYKKGKIVGQIYISDFDELKKVGNSCNAQISILEKAGVIVSIEKYKKRIGLIIGAVISVLIIAFFCSILRDSSPLAIR